MNKFQYAGLMLVISFWAYLILTHLRQVALNQVATARLLRALSKKENP